jgi:hypothetical protein
MQPDPLTQSAPTQQAILRRSCIGCLRRQTTVGAIAGIVSAALVLPGIALPAQQAPALQTPAQQTPAQQTPAPASSAPANTHAKKSSHSHAKAAVPQPAPLPAVQASVTPPAPPPPDWPANDHPSDATVTWDSNGLRIVAANSSLAQIMKAIAAETGATVEGMGQDQRIFGIYGPGRARDVVTQLLDGSGYNVLMVGDLGQGTPRQIILTSQTPGSPRPPGAGNSGSPSEEDTEAEQEPQPEPEPPPPPPQQAPAVAPAVPVRTQQQMIQELRERQEQQQQQQNQ